MYFSFILYRSTIGRGHDLNGQGNPCHLQVLNRLKLVKNILIYSCLAVDGLIKLFNRLRAEFLLFSVPPPAEKDKEMTIAWWGQGK